MGRRDRERLERIRAGLENPIARAAVKLKTRGAVIEELSRGTVSDQTNRLNTLVGEGALKPSRLKDAIMRKAPKEMDKAIKKFRKQGKEITVDSLTAEARTEPGFLCMCENVGLDLAWFENLAKDRMEANKV